MGNLKEVKDYIVDENGSNIASLIQEALVLARANSCFVRFSFNDIEVIVDGSEDIKKEVEGYHELLENMKFEKEKHEAFWRHV